MKKTVRLLLILSLIFSSLSIGFWLGKKSVSPIFISNTQQNNKAQNTVQNPQTNNGTHNNIPESPKTDSNPSQPSNPLPTTENTACGLETCHGLDISCGPNIALMCTMEYRIGDICLSYAQCGMQNGTCKVIENTKFNNCKTCVESCIKNFANSPEGALNCEQNCK